MSKTKIISSIVLISIIINLIWGIWLFVFMNHYLFSWNFPIEVVPWIKKLSTNKIVEEKIIENREIKDLENNITSAINKTSPSVVSIIISKDLKVYYEDPFSFFGWYVEEKTQKVWWWSWIIISSDWYILTNKHVVADTNSEYSVVTADWDNFVVNKIWLDPVLDIAILKIVDENWQIPDNLVTANIISSNSKVKIWQFAIAIWNALAQFENTATFWIISWKWRSLEQWSNDSVYIWLYQTDTAINPWNSWWPLLDINWDVIWINTAISSYWQWIWFSIPINKEFVNTTLDILKNEGKIERPFVWVVYVEMNKSIAKNQWLWKYSGVLVNEIINWSPADLAWLQKKDIILEVNWEIIDKDNPFLYNLYLYKPWDKIDFLIYRNNKYEKIEIILERY